MSDIFEKLNKIAKEEFGCTLVQGERGRTFKEVFGFAGEEIVDFDGFADLADIEISMNSIATPEFGNMEFEQFRLDSADSTSVSFAA